MTYPRHQRLATERLELVPITLPMVEAVFHGDKAACEALAGARMPDAWPNKALIERAFTASLDAIRADPAGRLWGDHLILEARTASERRVVGSVVFHGAPDDAGTCEVGYGIERSSQGRGYASEALEGVLLWAFAAGARRVVAATTSWHSASRRVLHKCGFSAAGAREHEALGELLLFERRATSDR